MKTIKLQNIFATVFAITIFSSVFSQRIAPAKEISMFNLTVEKESRMEKYSVKTYNENAYLQWHVENETESGIFIVQRSQNMLDFKIIGIKEDVKSPVSIMFGFVDKKPLPGISYYRILKVYKDGSYYYSDVESVEFEVAPETKEEQPEQVSL